MTNFVRRPFTLWATGDQIDPHAGHLVYSKDSPNSVQLVFPLHDGSETAEPFMVDREMLAAGLQHHASKGGIAVKPHRMDGRLVVTLPGLGDFYADAVVVRAFLDATADLVPMDVAA